MDPISQAKAKVTATRAAYELATRKAKETEDEMLAAVRDLEIATIGIDAYVRKTAEQQAHREWVERICERYPG